MNRRDFLKTSSLAGTSLALSTAAVGAPASGTVGVTDDIIRVGLIGAGLQGENLVGACLDTWESTRVHFRAVCDVWDNLNLPRMVSLLEKYDQKVNAYTDFRQMLDREKELDAILVATPDFCHAKQTIACLEAGLPVYCEAPLSNRTEDARRMIRAAQSTGKPLQVGYQRRSNPKYLHCEGKLLRSARLIGQLTAVNGQCNRSAQPDPGWSRRRALTDTTLQALGYPSMHAFKNWQWYKALGGGPLLDQGAHQIDVFNWFLGTTPKVISAHGGMFYHEPETHEWADTIMAILEYETRQGPLTAQFQVLTTNGYGGRVELFLGEQGSIELAEAAGRTALYRDPNTPDWDKWVRLGFLKQPGAEDLPDEEPGVIAGKDSQPPARYDLPVTMQDPYPTPHLTNFFNTILGQETLQCPADVAFTTLVTTLKIAEALESRRSLSLKPEDFAV